MGNRIVFIGNCDAQGNTKPTGSYATKVRFRGFRWVNYVDHPEDIVLIHEPFSFPPAYRSYRVQVFGFCPTILSPTTNPDPLDLALAISLDQPLLTRIKNQIRQYDQHRFSLVAAVNTAEVFAIGKYLGLPVEGPSQEQLETDVMADLNSKIWFVEQFEKMGFATPHGHVAQGKQDIMQKAHEIFKTCGQVMIRKPSEASEKGNIPLIGLTVEEIDERIDSLDATWFDRPLLVEPFLNLTDSPCTLGIIHPDGSKELLHTGTQLFAKTAYCWISPPDHTQEVIQEMEKNSCFIWISSPSEVQ
ncbi:hypothetical protein AUK40_05950 [Candidatus Wirthbacteria bacterium CG2_30_54_11]|uniref:ATP-grasp domain-containing protein n=1 Tax=Candidatus Wirthbacteria bacterium CG2_30_54_11 TaxID=1817892 RepID=A0A1J5IQX0_9BACT|nr:MAG: hypothetical protein AUK40_05950 [Candidatus Wirthbacteria bacterium CG2_30_54_11]